MRKKILSFFTKVLQSYDTSALVLKDVPDLLIGSVSHHRLSHSFEGHSQLLGALRCLMIIYQRRLSHIDIEVGSRVDRMGYHSGDLTKT